MKTIKIKLEEGKAIYQQVKNSEAIGLEITGVHSQLTMTAQPGYWDIGELYDTQAAAWRIDVRPHGEQPYVPATNYPDYAQYEAETEPKLRPLGFLPQGSVHEFVFQETWPLLLNTTQFGDVRLTLPPCEWEISEKLNEETGFWELKVIKKV